VNGKSDPYCVIEHYFDQPHNHKDKFKTKKKKATLNPLWDETFGPFPTQLSSVFLIKLFDHDVISKDDSLGFVPFSFVRLASGL